MIQYHITITSKNKNSIKLFIKFFNQIFKKFNKLKKYIKKKQKIKVLTILKSPHINKTAQEQFETRLYMVQTNVFYSQTNLKFLIFLKKLKISLFPDTKIKIKFSINNLSIKKTRSKILTPNNFKLKLFNKSLKNLNNIKSTKGCKNKKYCKKIEILKQTEYFLKIFDIYGNFIKA